MATHRGGGSGANLNSSDKSTPNDDDPNSVTATGAAALARVLSAPIVIKTVCETTLTPEALSAAEKTLHEKLTHLQTLSNQIQSVESGVPLAPDSQHQDTDPITHLKHCQYFYLFNHAVPSLLGGGNSGFCGADNDWMWYQFPTPDKAEKDGKEGAKLSSKKSYMEEGWKEDEVLGKDELFFARYRLLRDETENLNKLVTGPGPVPEEGSKVTTLPNDYRALPPATAVQLTSNSVYKDDLRLELWKAVFEVIIAKQLTAPLNPQAAIPGLRDHERWAEFSQNFCFLESEEFGKAKELVKGKQGNLLGEIICGKLREVGEAAKWGGEGLKLKTAIDPDQIKTVGSGSVSSGSGTKVTQPTGPTGEGEGNEMEESETSPGKTVDNAHSSEPTQPSGWTNDDCETDDGAKFSKPTPGSALPKPVQGSPVSTSKHYSSPMPVNQAAQAPQGQTSAHIDDQSQAHHDPGQFPQAPTAAGSLESQSFVASAYEKKAEEFFAKYKDSGPGSDELKQQRLDDALKRMTDLMNWPVVKIIQKEMMKKENPTMEERAYVKEKIEESGVDVSEYEMEVLHLKAKGFKKMLEIAMPDLATNKGEKKGHWIWWLFPTSKPGDSERGQGGPEAATFIPPEGQPDARLADGLRKRFLNVENHAQDSEFIRFSDALRLQIYRSILDVVVANLELKGKDGPALPSIDHDRAKFFVDEFCMKKEDSWPLPVWFDDAVCKRMRGIFPGQ